LFNEIKQTSVTTGVVQRRIVPDYPMISSELRSTGQPATRHHVMPDRPEKPNENNERQERAAASTA